MERYVGLMSGTSLDGVDVAVVGFEGEGEDPSLTKEELEFEYVELAQRSYK